ncbi:MAG: hypothetical protein ACPGO3_05475 [Magnetospiraceae bacterium]
MDIYNRLPEPVQQLVDNAAAEIAPLPWPERRQQICAIASILNDRAIAETQNPEFAMGIVSARVAALLEKLDEHAFPECADQALCYGLSCRADHVAFGRVYFAQHPGEWQRMVDATKPPMKGLN